MGSDHSHTRSPAPRPAAMNTEEVEVSTVSSPQSIPKQSRQRNLKSRVHSVGNNETHFRDSCSHTKSLARPSTSMRHWGRDRCEKCVKSPSLTCLREHEKRSDSPRMSKCMPARRPSLPGLRALSLEAITQKDRRLKLQGTSRSQGEAGFRNSDRKSDCIPDSFSSALRRAVKEKKPSKIAVLLRNFPDATRSGLLFHGDCECLAAMNDIVLRRDANLLAACLKRGACTPEQIWPSSAAGGQGPALSLLFSPLFSKDRTKGLSRELDKHLSQCFHSSPSMDFSLEGRQASSPSLRHSSSMIYEPSRYTYLYLPRLPKGDSSEDRSRGGAPSPYRLQKSLPHSQHSGKTCQDRTRTAGGSGSWLGSFTAGYGRRKVHPVRSSEEARRVAQILQRQRALRLGDIILLDADDACVEVLLPHISRPSLFLVAAAARGTKEVVEALLRKGANPNTNVHGLTPINVAASSPVDATEKVELLLRHGAAPDAPLLPSAPHSAAAAPIVSAAAVPPRGVPTVSGVEDLPALMHAVMTGDLVMAELLLQQGADPNIFVEYMGLPTPLFQAVFWGDLKMVKLLCSHGADPYMVKQSGETLFETANRALKFALMRKPKHISRLPLPRTTPATCRQIRRILDDCCSERASAAREAAAAAVARVPEDAEPHAAAFAAAEATAVALAAGPPSRARLGFRAAWESRVVDDDSDRDYHGESTGLQSHIDMGVSKSRSSNSSTRGMTGRATTASFTVGRTRMSGGKEQLETTIGREISGDEEGRKQPPASGKAVTGLYNGCRQGCQQSGSRVDTEKSVVHETRTKKREKSRREPLCPDSGIEPPVGSGLSLSFEVTLRTPRGDRRREVEKRSACRNSSGTHSSSSPLPRRVVSSSPCTADKREDSFMRPCTRQEEVDRCTTASRTPHIDRMSSLSAPVQASETFGGAVLTSAFAKAPVASSVIRKHSSQTSAGRSDRNSSLPPVRSKVSGTCSSSFSSGSTSDVRGPTTILYTEPISKSESPSVSATLIVSSEKYGAGYVGRSSSPFSSSSGACASTECSSDS
ncbi:ankyrin repeat-containing protein [Cystoisospora suis]|uniref:Ankyrin repeat-containing protein n=1 Tax=Cystoisospora suis TaxID=483139 RepID=A0A2C6KUD8_9APIC|nr:ankyrin repeat-containing protein [Cystoisospora suis]